VSLASKLKLLKLDYNVRRVRVIFLRDYPKLPTPSGLIDARRGDEVELPRWQARILKDQGYVDFREQQVDIDYVNRYHFKERKSSGASQLIGIPQDFYFKAGELVGKLNIVIRENPSHALLRDREITEKNIIDIAEARLSKILRLVYSESRDIVEKVTPEEFALFNYMLNAVEQWRSYIKSIARGDLSG